MMKENYLEGVFDILYRTMIDLQHRLAHEPKQASDAKLPTLLGNLLDRAVMTEYALLAITNPAAAADPDVVAKVLSR